MDLNLGSLKDEVGHDGWTKGEAVRFNLPKAMANAGWGLRLGNYCFPATGETKDVADLFFWKAEFDGPCRIEFKKDQDIKAEEADGAILLEGTAQVRIACYSKAEKLAETKAFEFCHAMKQLCKGTGQLKMPYLNNAGCWPFFSLGRDYEGKAPRHPRSGSCPPIQGW